MCPASPHGRSQARGNAPVWLFHSAKCRITSCLAAQEVMRQFGCFIRQNVAYDQRLQLADQIGANEVTRHGIGADLIGKLETLIVSDILPNETTKLAHYLLRSQAGGNATFCRMKQPNWRITSCLAAPMRRSGAHAPIPRAGCSGL